jgi:hypothetical protein
VSHWGKLQVNGLCVNDILYLSDTPGLADICLIPQLVNARRFGVALTSERILAIEAACLVLEAFGVPGEV